MNVQHVTYQLGRTWENLQKTVPTLQKAIQESGIMPWRLETFQSKTKAWLPLSFFNARCVFLYQKNLGLLCEAKNYQLNVQYRTAYET